MAQTGEDGSSETRTQRVSSSRQHEVIIIILRATRINCLLNNCTDRYDFCRNVAGPALGLPGDPWLTPPGLLSALPGFLAAPHTGYPSYLTSPRRLPSPPNVGAVGSAVPGELLSTRTIDISNYPQIVTNDELFKLHEVSVKRK